MEQVEGTVSAAPTKEFFISMLVRDIDLIDAVVDLVDNCVDGARRIRNPPYDFRGLWARLTVSAAKFEIKDNCGGIPYDLAANYAFCFGRPKEAQGVEHSIGRFGVGMKRAFFKMGERFSVETQNGPDHYRVGTDVRNWRGDPGNWTFPFARLPTLVPAAEDGTTIDVSGLYDPVKQDFGDEAFIERIKSTLGSKHHQALSQGLGITVNGVPVQFREIEVLQSVDLEPAVSAFEIKLRKPVAIKVIAGLGPSEPRAAGWNVYCNGRLVVQTDTTPMTGWGAGVVPKFHNQFAEFRGFAFMECDDPDLLPWRTTKTGVDVDSIVYRRVLQEMVDLTRPVIDFLNLKKEEADSAREEERLLQRTVDTAKGVTVESLTENRPFKGPEPDYEPLPEEAKITYWETIERISRVKTHLRVRKNPDVGKRTFQYYYEAEVEG